MSNFFWFICIVTEGDSWGPRNAVANSGICGSCYRPLRVALLNWAFAFFPLFLSFLTKTTKVALEVEGWEYGNYIGNLELKKKKKCPGSNLGMLEKSGRQSKWGPVSTTPEPEPLPAWPLPGVYTLVYSFCCALLKRKVHQLSQFLLLRIRLSCLTSFYDSILMCETGSKNDCTMLLWGKMDTM